MYSCHDMLPHDRRQNNVPTICGQNPATFPHFKLNYLRYFVRESWLIYSLHTSAVSKLWQLLRLERGMAGHLERWGNWKGKSQMTPKSFSSHSVTSDSNQIWGHSASSFNSSSEHRKEERDETLTPGNRRHWYLSSSTESQRPFKKN